MQFSRSTIVFVVSLCCLVLILSKLSTPQEKFASHPAVKEELLDSEQVPLVLALAKETKQRHPGSGGGEQSMGWMELTEEDATTVSKSTNIDIRGKVHLTHRSYLSTVVPRGYTHKTKKFP